VAEKLEDLPITGTPVLGDTPRKTKVGWSVVQEDSNADTRRDLPEYRAIPDRIALLARKFALKDKFSEEDNARLAIVTERVRQLLPSIKVEEYEILAEVLATVKSVAEDDLALAEGWNRKVTSMASPFLYPKSGIVGPLALLRTATTEVSNQNSASSSKGNVFTAGCRTALEEYTIWRGSLQT